MTVYCVICQTSTGEFSRTCKCGALVDARPIPIEVQRLDGSWMPVTTPRPVDNVRPYARYEHEPLVVSTGQLRGLIRSGHAERIKYLEAQLVGSEAIIPAIANYKPASRRVRLGWRLASLRARVGFWIAGYNPREDD